MGSFVSTIGSVLLALAAAMWQPRPASAQSQTQLQAPDGVLAMVVLASELDGRTYYDLERNTTCLANDLHRTRIRTWRQRIEFRSDRILVWGSLCNDQAQVVEIPAARLRLRVSPDLSVIEFDQQLLHYAASSPALCEQGTWCPEDKH